jgi:hypothetical protein
MSYLFNNQVKEYNQNFEKSLYKIMEFLELENEWQIVRIQDRIKEIKEDCDNLEMLSRELNKMVEN